MEDEDKSREQLLEELREMRKKLSEVKSSPEQGDHSKCSPEGESAQRLLRQTKERLEAILNATTDVACLTDSSGVYLALNEALAQRLGKTVDELQGKVAFQFFPPDVAMRRRERLARVIETRKPLREEESNNGRVFDESVYPILDSAGNVKAVAIFARDITEQKQAEEALRHAHDELDKRVRERTSELSQAVARLEEEISQRQKIQEELAKSELLHRMLVETAKDIIWSVDLDLNYTFVSPSVQEVLGFTVEEIMGMNPRAVLTPSSRELILRAFEEELSLEQPTHRDRFVSRTLNIEHLHKNGSLLWLEITTTLLRDEHGAPVGIIGISRDITKRKRQEEALKESKETIEALLNATTDHAVLLDAQTNFLALNEAVARRLGVPRRELIGKQAVDYFLPSVRERRQRWFDEVISTGKGVRFEDELDGRFFDNSLYPILDDKGRVKAVAIFARDMTDQKIAEDQLRASLKENEVLLREVHHRVKNNLQVVSSLLNLQSRNMKEKTYEQMFSVSRNRIRSMALIHEKLYKASDLAHIDFKEYITSLLSDLFHSFGANGNRIAVKLDIEAGPLTVDIATPCALVTNELVSNCIKHAFPDPRSGIIRIGFAAAEDEFELVVSDTGVGLPEDIDLQYPQTLGLRLVNTLVKQLGGRMEVRSTDGAEFRIRFKRSTGEALREEIS